jgi:hypothetical protein
MLEPGSFFWISRPKTYRGAWLQLLAGSVLAVVSISYLIWRTDQPPENPGGPMRGQGFWILLWNAAAVSVGPLIGGRCLANAIPYLWRRWRRGHTEAEPR